MNSLKINFDKEELEIDGTKITKPFIVSVPHDDGYQRTKVFNHKNGWKAGEKTSLYFNNKNLIQGRISYS